MNLRRVMLAAAVVAGAAMGVTLAACGGHEEGGGSAGATAEKRGSASSPNYSNTWQDRAGNVSYHTYDKSGGNQDRAYDQYKLTWSSMASNGDLVLGTGWKTGGTSPVYYGATADYRNTCGGCLGVYGWTRNPLIEYYICDATGDVEGPHNSSSEKPEYRCTVDSDGDTYDVYYNLRTCPDANGKPQGCPNITGQNQNFAQYISIRRNPRAWGKITVKNHFDKWASTSCKSMKLGNTWDYVVLGTEGWGRGNNAQGKPICPNGASGSSSIMLNPPPSTFEAQGFYEPDYNDIVVFWFSPININVDDSGNSFSIERKIAGGSYSTLVSKKVAPDCANNYGDGYWLCYYVPPFPGSGYLDVSFTSGKTYTYRVKATNQFGSSYSNEVTVAVP